MVVDGGGCFELVRLVGQNETDACENGKLARDKNTVLLLTT